MSYDKIYNNNILLYCYNSQRGAERFADYISTLLCLTARNSHMKSGG